MAQKAVLGPCSGEASGPVAKKIRRQINKALEGKGVQLVAPAAYMQAAKREKLARRAFEPEAVARLAPALSLDGVITCSIQHSKGRYAFVFKVLGTDGKVRGEIRLRNKKPVLGRPGIAKVAEAAQTALSGGAAPHAEGGLDAGDDIALIPLVPLVPVDAADRLDDGAVTPADPAAAARPSVGDDKAPGALDSAASGLAPKNPIIASGGPGDGTTDEPAGAPAGSPDDERKPSPIELALMKPGGEVAAPAAPEAALATSEPAGELTQSAPREPGEPKSVPDAWVAAGASMHLRAGLNPRYEAGPFPGFRVEGRAFLGSVIDIVGLEDLGLEFAYDRGIGLSYSSAFRPDKVDAYEQHWRVGLVYRLSFEEVLLGPAVLFRVGYGGTTNGVDQAYPDIVSAGYSHLDLTIDAHVWLVRPLLKAYLAAGWLALVTPGESLSGSGMGLTFGGGLAVELIDALHLSAGYEQWQFVFDEDIMGKTSDRFQMLFVRAGWSYR